MAVTCRVAVPALLAAVLAAVRVAGEADADKLMLRQGGGGLGHVRARGEPEYNKETKIVEVTHPMHDPGSHNAPGLDVTVEVIFAIIYVAIIASVPVVFVQLEQDAKMGWVTLIQVIALVVWLVGGLALLTNIILFQSVHWDGHRPLTIVETVYLLSQIITTVGYGDITPAKPRGQVVIGFYILMSLLVIANMVSEVSSMVVSRVQSISAKGQSDPLGMQATRISRVREEGEDDSEVPDEPEVTTRRISESSGAGAGLPIPGLHGPQTSHGPDQFTDPASLKLYRKPTLEYTRLLISWVTFLIFGGAGVLFYHWYPGEEKTWLQAIYMSVITLSTVGFGAFNASTEGGKVFGAFWMLLGVAALVNLVTAFTEVTLKLKEIERWDHETVAQEMKDNLARVVKEDEGTINRHQFIKFALLQCKLANEGQLAQIEKEWSRLRPDSEGLINTDIFYDQLHQMDR